MMQKASGMRHAFSEGLVLQPTSKKGILEPLRPTAGLPSKQADKPNDGLVTCYQHPNEIREELPPEMCEHLGIPISQGLGRRTNKVKDFLVLFILQAAR